MMRALASLSLALFSCTTDSDARSQERARTLVFPVEVLKLEPRAVDFEVHTVGSLTAYEIVRVTARVAGVVDKVRFVEGNAVKDDQILVEIEPVRFATTVGAAKATLERARAGEAEAKAGLARRNQALEESPGLITAEELETWRTKMSVAAAETAQAKAALDQAQLNLHDAYLRAPMAGAIQSKTVVTGQYLQPGDVVATLVRRDPMVLRFQVTEGDAQRIATGMAARFRVQTRDTEYRANITHIAGSADSTTRMVSVNAEIEGGTEELRPGIFADITITVGQQQEAVLIPETSIRPSERGFLAYVVVEDKANERVIEPGMRTGEGLVEVRSGLRAGELLVVRGGEALKEGATVRVVKP